MEALTEQEWEETTPDQWRAMVVGFTSQDFKEILDEMTGEQIMEVWECFEPWMSDKFFDNLRREDIEDFTLGEWRATMHLPVEEIKARFFDHMIAEEILELAAMLDDDEDLMGQFLRNLPKELYQEFTPDEWDALFIGLDEPEDIVSFAQDLLEKDIGALRQVIKAFRVMKDKLPEDIRKVWRKVANYVRTRETQT